MSIEEQIKHGLILDVNIRKYGVEQLMPLFRESDAEGIREISVCTLSLSGSIISAFGKITANHSGYCLEFANDGIFRLANEVSYGEAPEFDISDDDQRSSWFLFYKRIDYRGEEEVRMHVPRMFSGGLVPFDPQHLTRVTLGEHMPEADRALIREWGKQQTPEVKVATAFWDSDAQDIRIDG